MIGFRMKRTLISLALFMLLASAGALSAASRPDMLVSTEWLAGHLNDPNVVVLQISRERATWEAGHIPGARFVALSDLVVTRDGVLNELPPAADLKKVFEAAGVSDSSRVILYTDATVLPATRAWFTFDYLGFGAHAALLDGGLQKWRAENRALSKDAPQVTAGHFTPRLHPEVLATLEPVKDLSWSATNGSGAVVLLDARTAEEFRGERAASEITRPGHIPGAVNIFWQQDAASKDSPALRGETDLRKLYEAAGITPDKTVVTYCNTGMQATESYFTLKYLGYETRLYDGSFSEWSSAKNTTVQK